MKKIFKYKLNKAKEQTLTLPRDAQFLSVQFQKYDLCVWAIVDPEETRTENHLIYIYGTGEGVPFPTLQTHLATVQDGPWVWHVFRRNIP